MAPLHQHQNNAMINDQNDKQSTEECGDIGKPAVRRSLFHRLNWPGFWVVAVLSLLAALSNDNLRLASGLEYWALVGLLWLFGVAIATWVLIEGRER
jgi:hypothetical protein